MKLEYIILFKEEGVPIYSQCYGSFCARVAYDDSLYSGFLSALTTMPKMFGDSKGLQTVELGFTTLHFSKTTPSGHNICVGIDKATEQDIDIKDQLDLFYQRVNAILEGKYGDYDWIQTSKDDIEEFENIMLHEAIYPTFPYFYNNEVCKEDCPFDHEGQVLDPETKQPLNIVEKFKKNYSKPKELIKQLLGWIYLPLYRWFDLRGYRKRKIEYQEKIQEQTEKV